LPCSCRAALDHIGLHENRSWPSLPAVRRSFSSRSRSL
jgi:hypothetical protein